MHQIERCNSCKVLQLANKNIHVLYPVLAGIHNTSTFKIMYFIKVIWLNKKKLEYGYIYVCKFQSKSLQITLPELSHRYASKSQFK